MTLMHAVTINLTAFYFLCQLALTKMNQEDILDFMNGNANGLNTFVAGRFNLRSISVHIYNKHRKVAPILHASTDGCLSIPYL